MTQAPETEVLYSAKYVADALGISASMLRRYAISLEGITGPIKSHPRDGRQYTQSQLDTLLKAKGYIDGNAGLSTSTAIQLALGRTGLAVPIREPKGRSSDLDTEQLAQALARALQQAQEPVLAELRAITAQLEAQQALSLELQQSSRPAISEAAQQHDAAPAASSVQSQGPVAATEPAPSGPLVRAAVRVEGWLRGLLKR